MSLSYFRFSLDELYEISKVMRWRREGDGLVDCWGYIDLCERYVVCELGERVNVCDLAEELGTVRATVSSVPYFEYPRMKIPDDSSGQGE